MPAEITEFVLDESFPFWQFAMTTKGSTMQKHKKQQAKDTEIEKILNEVFEKVVWAKWND